MTALLIFYLIAGTLLMLDVQKEDSVNNYSWLPLTWFFVLIYNVFFRDRNNNL